MLQAEGRDFLQGLWINYKGFSFCMRWRDNVPESVPVKRYLTLPEFELWGKSEGNTQQELLGNPHLSRFWKGAGVTCPDAWLTRCYSLKERHWYIFCAVQASIAANTYVVSGPSQVQSELPIQVLQLYTLLPRSRAVQRFFVGSKHLCILSSTHNKVMNSSALRSLHPVWIISSLCRHPGSPSRNHEPDWCRLQPNSENCWGKSLLTTQLCSTIPCIPIETQLLYQSDRQEIAPLAP